MSPELRETIANAFGLTHFEAGADRRGLGWLVSYTGIENEDHDNDEIQVVDCCEPVEDFIAEEYAMKFLGWDGDNPWFEYDDEAWIHVLFLALSGDKDARAALREIGCTRADLACL